MMLTALENRDPSRRISELMNVTYSMQILAGMLVLTMGAYFFAERAAQRGQRHHPAVLVHQRPQGSREAAAVRANSRLR
jgi:hypothetical protein